MGWRSVVVFMILALVAGAGGFAWLNSTGTMPWRENASVKLPDAADLDGAPNGVSVAGLATPIIVQPVATQAETQLLVSQARRALEAGQGLGNLQVALQARFGQSQPQALAAILDSARQPLSNAQLLAGFDAIAPELVKAQGTTWERLQMEANTLFVLRPGDSKPTPTQQRVQTIREHIIAGHIADAVAAVRKLPGAVKAGDWIVTANRAIAMHRTLDQLAQSMPPPALAPVPDPAPVPMAVPDIAPDPALPLPAAPTE